MPDATAPSPPVHLDPAQASGRQTSRRPAMVGTIVRTTMALTVAAAALSTAYTQMAWPVAPIPAHSWVTIVPDAALGGVALLYSMMRIGGMGTCITCGALIPALWGGSYCETHEGWSERLIWPLRIIEAWSRLVALHGPDRVRAMVDELGADAVLSHQLGGIPLHARGVSEAAARRLITGSSGYHYTRDGHPRPGVPVGRDGAR